MLVPCILYNLSLLFHLYIHTAIYKGASCSRVIIHRGLTIICICTHISSLAQYSTVCLYRQCPHIQCCSLGLYIHPAGFDRTLHRATHECACICNVGIVCGYSTGKIINSPSCDLCSLSIPGKLTHCSVWSPPCPPRSTHSQKRISTLRGENPTQRENTLKEKKHSGRRSTCLLSH